jgi:hypothetical protein
VRRAAPSYAFNNSNVQRRAIAYLHRNRVADFVLVFHLRHQMQECLLVHMLPKSFPFLADQPKNLYCNPDVRLNDTRGNTQLNHPVSHNLQSRNANDAILKFYGHRNFRNALLIAVKPRSALRAVSAVLVGQRDGLTKIFQKP